LIALLRKQECDLQKAFRFGASLEIRTTTDARSTGVVLLLKDEGK
jgi:hypothetical protein